ncbi:branched-chain amino acid ABC transporter permease [Limibacillus halophilus]|uniref:Branched-chain amino acid transport system permease protein n=1 Tax=Limibacillus halophilus TaxID=1579333 RepID=A0A839SX10_9PROT|nr:branched-chain amino acid ABC transporter permease [Limibacillus halophilus]MBB3065483.1 branched-chain amino acid transport system permease protein [Limibacillus halophilus]
MDNIDILIQAPIFNVQLLLDGVLIGALFALAAYGMALVWGVMNIINIVQGEFVILGGFVAWSLFQVGVPPLFGIPAAAIALFILGYLLYKLVIFRLVDRDLFISLLATFGMSILLQQLMNEVFGADVQTVDTQLQSWFIFEGMVSVPQIKLLAFVLTLVIAVCLVVFMRKSRMGQAIRATAQNARAARILGIDTDKVYATTYGINAAVCGAAGALVVMSLTIHPFQGLAYTIRSFTIVVVAGLGNIAGVVASAFGLGVAEQYAGFVLGAEYQLAFVYLLLVVILMYRSFMLGRQRKYLK